MTWLLDNPGTPTLDRVGCAGHGQNAGQRSPMGQTKRLAFTDGYFDFPMKTNNLSDSKRQQTTTVDNKRLINGLVLTRVAPLQQSNLYYHVQTKEKPNKDQQKVQEYRENPYFCPE